MHNAVRRVLRVSLWLEPASYEPSRAWLGSVSSFFGSSLKPSRAGSARLGFGAARAEYIRKNEPSRFGIVLDVRDVSKNFPTEIQNWRTLVVQLSSTQEFIHVVKPFISGLVDNRVLV